MSHQRLRLAVSPEALAASEIEADLSRLAPRVPCLDALGAEREMHALSRRLWALEINRRIEMATATALIERQY